MTDDMTPKTSGPSSEAGSDEFSWTEPEQAGTDAGAKAREWLSQLQTMIENLATQATPVVKEISAKAAELAAIAGDKAGPAAQKAAELTGQAGQKLAEKSRDLAAELRRDVAATKAGGEGAATGTDTSDSDTPTTAGVA
jgi:hypothetical protein